MSEEINVINDEFGDLIQVPNARGGWKNKERVVYAEDLDGEIIEFRFNVATPKTKDYLTALESQFFNVRLNEMTWRLECNGEPLDDIMEAIVMNTMRDLGLRGIDHIRRAMQEMGHNNQYHPVKEYFETLPEWDKVDRLTKFFNCIKVSNPDIAYTFIRKWMIGAIAKVYKQEQNFMLVFSGGQGLGKSYLSRWLCPVLFVEGALNPNNKDTLAKMVSAFMWEVAELEGIFRRADIAALKDIITTPEITYRPPYARYDVTRPASASLIGTINPDGAGFMRDNTGNRRYGMVEIIDIDHDYTKIDIKQLWAQVYQYYKAGENHNLTKEQQDRQNEINADYETVSMVEQMLLKHYNVGAEIKEWTASTDIITELELQGLKGNQRSNLMELSGILTKAGLEKGKKNNVWGWYGVDKKR